MGANGSLDFPRGFMWGAATSSHQIEGGNSNNDWWDWEISGKAADPSGDACDSYNRYEEDFDLAKEMGHNSHRFSIEWSRVEPREGEFSEEALAHYSAVIDALVKRGLEPIVTLHHFTNPKWFAAKGGWESPEAPRLFTRFARKTASAMGARVRYWCTINEPMVFVFHGYLSGFWTPGLKSLGAAFRVLARMSQAHCLSYEALHAVHRENGWQKPLVGLAHSMQVFAPRTSSWRDKLAVWLRYTLNNRLCLKLVQHSAFYLPAWLMGTGGRKRTLDFIGLNYYFREILETAGKKGLESFTGEPSKTDERYLRADKSDLGWEIHPEGMHELLIELKRYGVPLMITENGICTSDEDLRARFVYEHLKQVRRAMTDGAPVIGYQYWSLLDNFEWAFGFKPRFGLVYVDYPTQKRTIKPSARFYAEICRSNVLPAAVPALKA